jgi:hypothetical protein
MKLQPDSSQMRLPARNGAENLQKSSDKRQLRGYDVSQSLPEYSRHRNVFRQGRTANMTDKTKIKERTVCTNIYINKLAQVADCLFDLIKNGKTRRNFAQKQTFTDFSPCHCIFDIC